MRSINKKIAFKKNILVSVLVLISLFAAGLFVSCGSTKSIADSNLGSVEDFTKKQLANGVPVIFKQNRGSKIIVCRVIFEGGTSTIDKSLSGIEDLTLDLALRGSEKYPYSKIQLIPEYYGCLPPSALRDPSSHQMKPPYSAGQLILPPSHS